MSNPLNSGKGAGEENNRRQKSLMPPTRCVLLVSTTALVIFGSILVSSHTSSALVGIPLSTKATGPIAQSEKRSELQPPLNTSAFAGDDNSVLITWQQAKPAPVGYRVYRATGHTNHYLLIGELNDAYITTFKDQGRIFSAGTSYSYTVRSYNRSGESAPTQPVVVVIVSPVGPTATPHLGGPLPTVAPFH